MKLIRTGGNMIIKQPGSCPVCKNTLTVTKISCESCGTELTGKFPPCKYCTLDEKLAAFLETFLRCRGNIKEIERELGISYPTVRNLTDELLSALNLADKTANNEAESVAELLEKVESGVLSAAEAAKKIRELKNTL
ncbi:MAG: DUF2089 domain-containing protein [Eubacteriales bacterium]|nr:DUF2089 domain-containing protein [Eubacteriales bacterium]MDD4474745.1 DUF2089 domain-containing protein [Eubacteriales bacterium]